MPAIFELRHTVQPSEIDGQGHVNNIEYLRWMQDAAVEHSAVQGWTSERYLDFGAVFVVKSHQIEYLQPAFAGDAIVVRTWVADMKKVTSLRRYRIVRAAGDREIVLAVAATDWAFIHFATGMPKLHKYLLRRAVNLFDRTQVSGSQILLPCRNWMF